MIEMDYITFMVQEKTNDVFLSGLTGNPLIHKIQQVLKIFTSKNHHTNTNESKVDGIAIKQMGNALQVQFSGMFFLKSNSNELLLACLNFLNTENYKYSITRIDYQITINTEFQNLIKEIRRTEIIKKKYKFIEIGTTKELEYVKYSSSRFALVAYNKSKELKQKNQNYKEAFVKKYKHLDLSKEIARIEVRFFTSENIRGLAEKLLKEADMRSFFDFFYIKHKKYFKLSKNLSNYFKESSI